MVVTDNYVNNHEKIVITIFITLIWKSVEILANCLAVIGAIKSRIAPFFAPNRIFFQPIRRLKHNNQSDFKASLK